MKTLCVRPEWAMPITVGMKTVECRTWRTKYRGDLLICSSARKTDGCVCGSGLCVVSLDSIEPFTKKHLFSAVMEADDMPDDAYAWILTNCRMVEPFPVKGRLNLFEVPDEDIHIIGEPTPELVERYLLPLVHRSKDSTAEDMWLWVYAEMDWPWTSSAEAALNG